MNWNNIDNEYYVRPVRQHSTSNPPSVLTYTIEKLWQAYKDCLSKKKNTVSALKFEIEREKNLFSLLEELRDRTYRISQHICFIINDPTPREIFAANFRDRVVHHFLCNEMAALFEEDFIDNSFANRKGKGTHKAVECVRNELQKGGFFLKLDIQAFFRSIDKDILFNLLQKKIVSLHKEPEWKEDMLWLCRTIISHDPVKDHVFCGQYPKNTIPASKSLFYANGRGLPIGNLTSQFFANVYMNELDQYIHSLGFTHIRYVDDFVIFSTKKEELTALISKIDEFLKQHLHLSLHPKKIILQHSSKGVDFLGYFLRPKYTLVRKRIVSRLKKKMRQGNAKSPVLNSYFGHFRHANTFNLRKSICEKVRDLNFDSEFTKFTSPIPQ